MSIQMFASLYTNAYIDECIHTDKTLDISRWLLLFHSVSISLYGRGKDVCEARKTLSI